MMENKEAAAQTGQSTGTTQLEASKKKSSLVEWIKDIAFAVIVVFILLQFFMPTIVREHSMENTLIENDYVFVSRRHYTWLGHELTRGDIIVCGSELITSMGREKMLVKRIVAIPGDTVSISNNNVFVNGRPSDQSYTKDGYTGGSMEEITVPEGCVFVLGDNRQNSTDSRSERVGFVNISDIKGKVVFRLFPLNKIGLM